MTQNNKTGSESFAICADISPVLLPSVSEDIFWAPILISLKCFIQSDICVKGGAIPIVFILQAYI